MKKLIAWLFALLQKRCPHDPSHVRADITEGDDPKWALQWCLRCGAYRWKHAHSGYFLWRSPRADWAEDF